MIPDSTAAVLGFFLLLAPGLVWEQRQSRYSPPVKESAFYEASRIILASSIATTAATALLGWWWWNLYQQAVENVASQSVAGVAPYLAAALATSALACFLALAASWWRWRKTPESIHGVPVWHRVFVGWRDEKNVPPVVTVELIDGTIWRGVFAAFDTTPEESQRCLALRGPLTRKRHGEETFTKLETKWKHLVLNQTQISSIRVAYPKSHD